MVKGFKGLAGHAEREVYIREGILRLKLAHLKMLREKTFYFLKIHS